MKSPEGENDLNLKNENYIRKLKNSVARICYRPEFSKYQKEYRRSFCKISSSTKKKKIKTINRGTSIKHLTIKRNKEVINKGPKNIIERFANYIKKKELIEKEMNYEREFNVCASNNKLSKCKKNKVKNSGNFRS